jgi:hypothetical protein
MPVYPRSPYPRSSTSSMTTLGFWLYAVDQTTAVTTHCTQAAHRLMAPAALQLHFRYLFIVYVWAEGTLILMYCERRKGIPITMVLAILCFLYPTFLNRQGESQAFLSTRQEFWNRGCAIVRSRGRAILSVSYRNVSAVFSLLNKV